MSIRTSLIVMLQHIAVACLLLAVAAATGFAEDARPNILLIVSDDQRADTIHALGNEVIRTPNLDRLVREGTAFTRAVTAIPICVASRAELLTGRNGLRNGHADFGFTPADNARCLAEVLRDAGYDTGYTGKWHTSGRPSSRGYAHAAGLFAGGGETLPLSFPNDWFGRPVTGYVGWVFQTDDRTLFPEMGVGLTPGISEVFADEAIRFIAAPRQKPFFLHLNFTAPHDPLHMPPGAQFRYSAADMPLPPNFAAEHPFDHGNAGMRDELLFQMPRTPDETRAELAVYYGLISHMDAQIGRVLNHLEDSGTLDNTIVVFTSDHGLAIGSHGLRGKQNMYEHTIGVPLLMRGPGIPAGHVCSAQCSLRDLYPTLCELARVDLAEPVDGRSLAPMLRGETDATHSEIVTHFRDVQRAIRTDRWKYITYPRAQREQLFDLHADPYELRDLSPDPAHQHRLTELRSRLEAELIDTMN